MITIQDKGTTEMITMKGQLTESKDTQEKTLIGAMTGKKGIEAMERTETMIEIGAIKETVTTKEIEVTREIRVVSRETEIGMNLSEKIGR